MGVRVLPARGSYTCPCVRPPHRPATGGVGWPRARMWASSGGGSDATYSSPDSLAPGCCKDNGERGTEEEREGGRERRDGEIESARGEEREREGEREEMER